MTARAKRVCSESECEATQLPPYSYDSFVDLKSCQAFFVLWSSLPPNVLYSTDSFVDLKSCQAFFGAQGTFARPLFEQRHGGSSILCTMSGCATPQYIISPTTTSSTCIVISDDNNMNCVQNDRAYVPNIDIEPHKIKTASQQQNPFSTQHILPKKPSIMQFAGPTFTHNSVYSIRTQDNKTLEAREQTVGSKNKLTSRITAWLRR